MISFPIAVLKGSGNPELAKEFVDLVVGAGQGILQDGGFETP